jgi:Tfp pilus assembly protein PilF
MGKSAPGPAGFLGSPAALEMQEAACRQALRAQPGNVQHLFNLAMLLMQQPAKHDEAIDCYRLISQLAPHQIEGHNNLGNLLFAKGQLEDALACFERALALKPGNVDVRNNIGSVLKELGKPADALEVFQKALKRKPGDADLLNNIGEAYRALDKPDEAAAHFRRALVIRPKFPQAEWNLGLVTWMNGDLAAGFRLYEKRFEPEHMMRFANTGLRAMLAKLGAKPRWRGEDLAGKNLLVWTEQGMGDTLMMMRYLPLLRQKNVGKLTVYCEEQLLGVFDCLGVPALGKQVEPPADSYDLHCSIMSLPHLFGTTLESIPADVPYLHIPAARSAPWNARLAEMSGMKIGLVWAGNMSMKGDRLRSIALDRFAPLMDMQGARFFSLQKGPPSAQLQGSGFLIVDWMSECRDLLDTAALIAGLDLVISVDTSIAHLAGAVGKPVWLLNRFESEWRWMREREDSPWYPSMRIFRQPALHDWDGVMQMLKTELAARLTNQ